MGTWDPRTIESGRREGSGGTAQDQGRRSTGGRLGEDRLQRHQRLRARLRAHPADRAGGDGTSRRRGNGEKRKGKTDGGDGGGAASRGADPAERLWGRRPGRARGPGGVPRRQRTALGDGRAAGVHPVGSSAARRSASRTAVLAPLPNSRCGAAVVGQSMIPSRCSATLNPPTAEDVRPMPSGRPASTSPYRAASRSCSGAASSQRPAREEPVVGLGPAGHHHGRPRTPDGTRWAPPGCTAAASGAAWSHAPRHHPATP